MRDQGTSAVSGFSFPSWETCQEVQRVHKKLPFNIKTSLDCAALPWKFNYRLSCQMEKHQENFHFLLLGLLVQKLLPR